jgi:hypothetical protein
MSWLLPWDVETRPSSFPEIPMPTGDAQAVDDAADALRRCAHAFADHRGTIVRAQRSLGDWSGEAKRACDSRCDTVTAQVDLFRHGSTDAATALRTYAVVLHHSTLAVARNIQEAEAARDRMARAQADAATAKAAAAAASKKATAAAAHPLGAPKAQDLQAEADAHAQQCSAHERTANGCQAEIDAIARRAHTHLEAIRDAAQVANTTLIRVASELPTIEPQNVDGPADVVLSTSTSTIGGSITIVIFKLGADHTVIQETQPGGATKVTIINELAAGLSATFGGKLNVGKSSGDKDAPTLGTSLTAELMAIAGKGRSWNFESPDEAEDFVHSDILAHLGADDGAIEEFRELGIDASAEGTVGSERASANANAEAAATVGARRDLVNGEITTYYKLMASAAAGAEVLSAGASAGAEGTSVTAVTRDKHGNIVKLAIQSGTSTNADVDLGAAADLREVASKIKEVNGGMSSSHKHVVQTDVQLNVDEHNRAIVEHYLKTLGRDPHAVDDLVNELDRDAGVVVTQTSVDESGGSIGGRDTLISAEGHDTHEEEQVDSVKIKLPGDDEFHTVRLVGGGVG